jgi:hypothetical protein
VAARGARREPPSRRAAAARPHLDRAGPARSDRRRAADRGADPDGRARDGVEGGGRRRRRELDVRHEAEDPRRPAGDRARDASSTTIVFPRAGPSCCRRSRTSSTCAGRRISA